MFTLLQTLYVINLIHAQIILFHRPHKLVTNQLHIVMDSLVKLQVKNVQHQLIILQIVVTLQHVNKLLMHKQMQQVAIHI